MGWLRTVGTITALAGKAWAAASWAWGNRVSILSQLGPPEYIAAIVFCAGIIVALNYNWINNLRPAVKFRNLAGEIEGIFGNIASDSEERYKSYNASLSAKEVELRFKLKKLGISVPFNVSLIDAIRLISYARLGEIKKAKYFLNSSAKKDKED